MNLWLIIAVQKYKYPINAERDLRDGLCNIGLADLAQKKKISLISGVLQDFYVLILKPQSA